jgi:hypothetical protein
MSDSAGNRSRGKLLALGLLLLGIMAALAEWRFRPAPAARPVIPGATTPATAP